MQASNKSDATQVYEGASRASRVGLKGLFKYVLRPLTIFSYHYFVEGIKAVQNDGPTKELEKITNLSYDETIRIMEKCQSDGIRVVATERELSTNENEFGKKKSLYQQRKITKYSRRIKNISNLKTNHPRIAKILQLDRLIKRNESKQNEQIKRHKNKNYNVYFNKSKTAYMGDRIADLIELRTGISKKLFDENTQVALEEIKKEGMTLNSQQMKELSEKFKLHDIGNVEISKFKKDYCIHEIPFSYYMSIKDDLEVADIQYGIKVLRNSEDEQIANIYFENKNLERYNELGFNSVGKINVYGNENKNMQWNVNSQDELVTFTTKTGEQEKKTYSILSGKNYVMKRQENECIWTVFKTDLKELADKEKKRDVVGEELENLKIFQNLEKEASKSPDISEIEVNFDNEINKEVGD